MNLREYQESRRVIYEDQLSRSSGWDPAPTDLDSEEWEVVAPKARKWAVKAEITGTGYRLVDDFMVSRFVFCELKLEAETSQSSISV
jgi:hypothetical protein